MSDDVSGLADLLGLPERARQSHRLTKKDIAAQWDHSAPADARLLTRAIASATIVGVLSPATIGAMAFEDADHRVDMIPVVSVRLAPKVKKADRARVADLLHRSMPRPAVLWLSSPDIEPVLSLAITRLSRTDPGKSVLEAHLLVPANAIASDAMYVTRLARSDLDALYRDLVRTAAADGYPASVALTAVAAVALRQRLTTLEAELAATAREAAREKAMQRRIDLNTRARTLRKEIREVRQALYRADPMRIQATDHKEAEQ